MNIYNKLHLIYPGSTHHNALQNFKHLTPQNQTKTIVLTIFAALATLPLFGLGGVVIFRLYVTKKWNDQMVLSGAKTTQIFTNQLDLQKSSKDVTKKEITSSDDEIEDVTSSDDEIEDVTSSDETEEIPETEEDILDPNSFTLTFDQGNLIIKSKDWQTLVDKCQYFQSFVSNPSFKDVQAKKLILDDIDILEFKLFLASLKTLKISASNVLVLYRLADRFQSEELKQCCVKYLEDNFLDYASDVTNLQNIIESHPGLKILVIRLMSLHLKQVALIDSKKFLRVVGYFDQFKNLIKDLDLSKTLIDDQGLSALTTWPLVKLNLSYCKNLTKLDSLALMTTLEHLNLSKLPKSKDLNFQFLTSLSNLTHLDLSDNYQNLKDDDLTHLACLTKLTELKVNNLGITEKGLTHLKALSSLNSLHLERCSIQNFSCLQSFSALSYLGLKCSNITDDDLVNLSSLKQLKELNLQKCTKLTGSGFTNLASLSIQHLNLSECICLNDLSSLQSWTSLKHLDLSDTTFKEDQLYFLPVNLRYLDLTAWSYLKSSHFNFISQLTQLTCLKLHYLLDTQFTTEDLVSLPLKSLEHLEINLNEKITDYSFIKYLVRIKYLKLTVCDNLKDKDLVYFKDLNQLEYLELTQNYQLTGTGFCHLTSLKALRHLALIMCDKIQTLDSLKEMTGLESLSLCFRTEKLIDLQFMSDLTNLKKLSLSSIDKDAFDQSLLGIKPLVNPNLETLNISNCTITNLDFLTHLIHLKNLELSEFHNLEKASAIKSLTQLETLTIWTCQSLIDFSFLTSLQKLQTISFHRCPKLDNTHLSHVKNLSYLEHISLNLCHALTHEGLKHLTDLPFLKKLGFFQQPNRVEIELIKKLLPNLIEFNV